MLLDTIGAERFSGLLRDARVAQRSAHYDAALELLTGCEDWPGDLAENAALIKADVIGRRSPIDGLEYLATVEDLFESTAGRFGRDIENGRLAAAVRDYGSAESRYADARALQDEVPYGTLTMAYHDLRMRWVRRDCDPHAPEIALALTHPDPSICSAAYAYRGWLHAGNENYGEHINDLMRAVSFAAYDGDDGVDAATLAASTHALAQVSFETGHEAGIAAAHAASESIVWTPDLQASHFMTKRAFGWDAFMRGNAGQAQWIFKEARALAPSAAWRIMGHLDRAYVARISQNEYWAVEELAQADALAFDVAWESGFGEERQVLVILAVLHARTDAARAQRYATMYSRIGTESVNPALAMHGDRRAVAHAKYAQGRIDQTLGRHAAAVLSLREAYRIFDASSFHYRAALAAAALSELTGEPFWREAAMAHASRYPSCPMVEIADHARDIEDAMPSHLSPMQRQLSRALCSGADLKDLSRRFSRSAYRIQRQIDAVYQAFDVTTRKELVEEARRRGLQ